MLCQQMPFTVRPGLCLQSPTWLNWLLPFLFSELEVLPALCQLGLEWCQEGVSLLEGESKQGQAVCLSPSSGEGKACSALGIPHNISPCCPLPPLFLIAALSLLQSGCFLHGFQPIRHGSGVTAARFTFP